MTRTSTRSGGRHARAATGTRGTDQQSVLGRFVAGDRPYILAFFALAAVLAMMIVGPLQSYTAAAERVHDLEVARADLQRQVDALEQRQQRLHDPEEIELLARERLGLVKPGEIPFVVTDGEPDTDQVRPDGRDLTPPLRLSVWQRMGRAFGSLFQR